MRYLTLAVSLCCALSTTSAFAQSWGQFKQAAGEAAAANNLPESERLWRQAVEVSSPDGATGPRYYSSIVGLAGVLAAQEKYADAEALYAKIVSAKEGGASGEEIDAGLIAYFALLRKTGKEAQAKELDAKYAVKPAAPTAATTTTGKPESASTDPWKSATERGIKLQLAKNLAGAELAYKEALNVAESQDNASLALDSSTRLMSLYKQENKFVQAESASARMVTLTKKLHGASSRQYADSLVKHADLLRKINKPNEAVNEEGKAEQILAGGNAGNGEVGAPAGGGGGSGSAYVNKGGQGTRGGSIYSRARSAQQAGGTGGSYADLVKDLLDVN